jgi:cobalt-zinc-cadmium efflux system membrane fusion protein
MMRLLGIAIITAVAAAAGWWVLSPDRNALPSSHVSAERGHKEGDASHAEGAGHDEKSESGKTQGTKAEDGDGHASEAKVIEITPAQRKEAGIVVEAVTPAPLPKVFRAPGEVRTNDYTTNSVTARYQAIVVTRKAKLGDRVSKGTPLVGLFSSEMAEAQTAFILAHEEYVRVQSLGRDIVAGRRFTEADAKIREARAKLETFGLATTQIDALARSGKSASPAGQFDIVAPQDGTIVADDIRMGSVVEPGKTLFVITTPGNVWVEAHVSPSLAAEIVGETARVFVAERAIEARVVQVQQIIDEATRTIGVRLQATSTDGTLKPGMFVDVELYGNADAVMSVPTNAIVRGPDGDWTIYIENAEGRLEPREIETLFTVGDRTAVKGLEAGTKVVTRGSFFVMAEAAKAGFDPHNH